MNERELYEAMLDLALENNSDSEITITLDMMLEYDLANKGNTITVPDLVDALEQENKRLEKIYEDIIIPRPVNPFKHLEDENKYKEMRATLPYRQDPGPTYAFTVPETESKLPEHLLISGCLLMLLSLIMRVVL